MRKGIGSGVFFLWLTMLLFKDMKMIIGLGRWIQQIHLQLSQHIWHSIIWGLIQTWGKSSNACKKIKIPHNVSFSIWRVLHDRLPTKDNLHKKTYPTPWWWPCMCAMWTRWSHISYNFFHACKFAQVLWWRWYEVLDICSAPLGLLVES